MEHVADLAPLEVGFESLGLDTRHLQEVLHDALEAAVGRLDLGSKGIALSKPIQCGADDGDGCLQLMRDAVKQRAMQALRLGEQLGAVLRGEELLALAMIPLQGLLTSAQPRDQMPHAECHDEEQRKHYHVLRLVDVQGELRRDENEIPHQRTHDGHRQNRSAIPPRAREHDGHEENERGKHIARERQQHPTGGGQHEDDHEPPTELPHHRF